MITGGGGGGVKGRFCCEYLTFSSAECVLSERCLNKSYGTDDLLICFQACLQHTNYIQSKLNNFALPELNVLQWRFKTFAHLPT